MRFGICTSIDNIESLENGDMIIWRQIFQNCTDGRSTVSRSSKKSRELKYKS